MKRYRMEAARAMAGVCMAAVLAASWLSSALGFELSKDQMALIILIAAIAGAAWLAEPRVNAENATEK